LLTSRRMCRRAALFVIFLAAVACETAPELDLPAVGFARVVDAGVVLDAAAPDAGTPDAGCTADSLPLRVTHEAEGPTRIYLPVEYQGVAAALLVDTGSQISFLSVPKGSPDPVLDAGVVKMGCELRHLPGRPIVSDEQIDGLRVVGFLGNDFFFERLTEIDLKEDKIRWPAPVNHAQLGWTALPFENVKDFIFVEVKLDGAPLRLGFDTGAAHALWLGQGPRKGDQAVYTQDAYGTPITLYLGLATLELANEPARQVPILRAPSFPSLEQSNALVGGKIDGLLGLTSVGDRRIRIDAASSKIWLER
jgi:hypothetical protein